MVAPTEDTEHAPATYVPPPFAGLPDVFQPDERGPRSWRTLRPSKSPRRRKTDEAPPEPETSPKTETKANREPVTAPVAVLALSAADEAEILHTRVAEVVVAPEPVVEDVVVAPEPVVEDVVVAPEPVVEDVVVAPEPVAEDVRVVVETPPVVATPPPAPLAPTITPRAIVQLPPLVELLPEPAPEPEPEAAPPAPPVDIVAPAPPPPVDIVAPAPPPPVDIVAAPAPVEIVAAPAPVVEPVVTLSAPPTEAVAPPVEAVRRPASHAAQPRRRVFARDTRPAPPKPTGSPAPALQKPGRPTLPVAPPVGLITYDPAPYDPAVAGEFKRVNLSVVPGQYGTVYPAARTGRGVWVVLFLIAALAVGLVGWHLRSGGSSDAPTGVAYTSTAGHFTADFPSQPSESTTHHRYGRVRATYHFAGIPTEAFGVLELDLSRRIATPSKKLLDNTLRELTGSGLLTLLKKTDTTIGGRPAQQADYYAENGRLITVLDVAYSGRRFYVLMAQSGDAFDGLKKSFVATQ